MVQWWYGHNAVGFFPDAALGHDGLRCPSKLAVRCSPYRLSVVHFWALIFTYMWAGPHHLLHRPAGLDSVAGYGGVLADSAGSVLGWHDQRHR